MTHRLIPCSDVGLAYSDNKDRNSERLMVRRPLLRCSGTTGSSYTDSQFSSSLQFLGQRQRRRCWHSRRRTPARLRSRRSLDSRFVKAALGWLSSRCGRIVVLLAFEQLHFDAAASRAVSVSRHASLRVGRWAASVERARQPASATSSLAVERRRHRRRHRERL